MEVVFWRTRTTGQEDVGHIVFDGKNLKFSGPYAEALEKNLTESYDVSNPRAIRSMLLDLPTRFDGGYLKAQIIKGGSGKPTKEALSEAIAEAFGGYGSGHHGHGGRKGQRGGSTPGTGPGAMSAKKQIKSDLTVANTIIKQMGGMRRLKLMVGAHSFSGDSGMVQFGFKGNRSMNKCRIEYDRGLDLYNFSLWRIRGGKNPSAKEVYRVDGIYFDQLQSTFEEQTGLYLHL